MMMNNVFFQTDPIPKSWLKTSNGFKTELGLVNHFESLIKEHFVDHSTGLIKEFECGDGIADIVIYQLRQDWQSSLSIGEMPSRWVYAIHSLPYRKIFTTDDLINISGVSTQRARKALNELVALGLCEKKSEKDTWIKLIQPRPLTNSIYAIEAKLKNWKRALEQATRYQDYAEQSWVLLDEKSINPAITNIDQFKHFNIGLASISKNGILSRFFTPKISKPRSIIRYWEANSVIAKHLK